MLSIQRLLPVLLMVRSTLGAPQLHNCEGSSLVITTVTEEVTTQPTTISVTDVLDTATLTILPTQFPVHESIPSTFSTAFIPSVPGLSESSSLTYTQTLVSAPTTLVPVVPEDISLVARSPSDVQFSSSVATSVASVAAPKPSSSLDKVGNAATSGMKNVVYFTKWSIYQLGLQPSTMPVEDITHLIYSFADIAPDGSVISDDEYADVQKAFPGDSWATSGNNVMGNVNQMYKLKQRSRTLKTLLSIGGWTYSLDGKFKPVGATPEGRQRFCSSAVKHVAEWGFDGLDIDWEYPETLEEGQQLVELLKECRHALDSYAAENGQDYHYLLTVASAASPDKLATQDLAGMDASLDFWNVMTYDYAGSWDDTTGHQANLFMDESDPTTTKFSTKNAINAHIAGGVPSDKLVLGLPLYGRSFMGTHGIGESYASVRAGTLGVEPVFIYRDLPLPGATVTENLDLGTAYSYDPITEELISFDTVNIAKRKAQYVRDEGLGGAMFWEAAGDKVGEDSLVKVMARELGGLDRTQNMLSYPQSPYDNIKNA